MNRHIAITVISFVFLFAFNSCGIDSSKNEGFYLHDNGISIMCPNTSPGDVGVVNGIEYESVNRNLLINKSNNGDDLTNLCTSLVSNMSYLFCSLDEENSDCESNLDSFSQDIGNWDVSNVTNMSGMFMGSTFNQEISDWDVGSVKDMSLMFFRSQFDHNIESWDVSNVTNMSGMFMSSSFNHYIGGWDVSKVEIMSNMFLMSQFNQNIGGWDVSSVEIMYWMFYDAEFNQDISNWCVTNFSSEPDHFSTKSPLSEENKPNWGACPNS